MRIITRSPTLKWTSEAPRCRPRRRISSTRARSSGLAGVVIPARIGRRAAPVEARRLARPRGTFQAAASEARSEVEPGEDPSRPAPVCCRRSHGPRRPPRRAPRPPRPPRRLGPRGLRSGRPRLALARRPLALGRRGGPRDQPGRALARRARRPPGARSGGTDRLPLAGEGGGAGLRRERVRAAPPPAPREPRRPPPLPPRGARASWPARRAPRPRALRRLGAARLLRLGAQALFERRAGRPPDRLAGPPRGAARSVAAKARRPRRGRRPRPLVLPPRALRVRRRGPRRGRLPLAAGGRAGGGARCPPRRTLARELRRRVRPPAPRPALERPPGGELEGLLRAAACVGRGARLVGARLPRLLQRPARPPGDGPRGPPLRRGLRRARAPRARCGALPARADRTRARGLARRAPSVPDELALPALRSLLPLLWPAPALHRPARAALHRRGDRLAPRLAQLRARPPRRGRRRGRLRRARTPALREPRRPAPHPRAPPVDAASRRTVRARRPDLLPAIRDGGGGLLRPPLGPGRARGRARAR